MRAGCCEIALMPISLPLLWLLWVRLELGVPSCKALALQTGTWAPGQADWPPGPAE